LWRFFFQQQKKTTSFTNTGLLLNSRFVKSLVLGSEQYSLRFTKGSGLGVPMSSVAPSGDDSVYTIAMLVKFDRANCLVRLINANPNDDSGLYLCDGIQLLPEPSAGRPLNAMQWYHIAVSTDKTRLTKLYIDGQLIYSWKPTKGAWKGLRLGTDEITLFNDCGHQCGCDSDEDSGGWISSLVVYNRQVTDQEIEGLYDRAVASTGLIADYDLTTNSFENPVDADNVDDLLDYGGLKCARAARYFRQSINSYGDILYCLFSPGLNGLFYFSTFPLLFQFHQRRKSERTRWLVSCICPLWWRTTNPRHRR
jgi:hypothetical protein